MDATSYRGIAQMLTIVQVALAGIVGAQIGKLFTGGDMTLWIVMTLAIVALVVVWRARRAVRRLAPAPRITESEDA